MMAVLISYAVGTLLGLFLGWNKGVENGSTATMKMLIENDFLQTQEHSGKIVILPISESDSNIDH